MIKNILRLFYETYKYRAVSPDFTNLFCCLLDVKRQKLNTGRLYRFRLGDINFYARANDWWTVEEIVLNHEYGFVKDIFDSGS
ncbi:MAG: hypothetical protein AB1546_11655, partial [bacterium]